LATLQVTSTTCDNDTTLQICICKGNIKCFIQANIPVDMVLPR
jgi:hypothetical protein